ncbi:PqqD family peptide modification chaperone [Methanospirillum lacunae]
MMTNQISIPTPESHISLREEYDDWALLFNPDTGKAVGLTPTGVTIWKYLNEGKDLNGIIALIQDEYESLPADLTEDIKNFCDQVVWLGYAQAGSYKIITENHVMKTPKSIDIDITSRCNLKCKNCFHLTNRA